jgi:hypothetical protein
MWFPSGSSAIKSRIPYGWSAGSTFMTPRFLCLLAIGVDFVAEDKGGPSADRPLMKSVGAQMQARIPVADSSVVTELKVLFESEHVLIVLECVIEIAHLKDRTYSLCFHLQCVPQKRPKDVTQEFQSCRQTFVPAGRSLRIRVRLGKFFA